MLRARVLSLLPFGVLALAVLVLPAPAPARPVTREVTLAMNQFAFDPPVLRVNRGDQVALTLQSTDVVHGFYLDGHNIDVRVEPGVSQQVEFLAGRSGKFRFRCSVACGSLHPFMIGELVVGPNLPFYRAVALTLIVLAATLFYLWRFPLG